MPAFVAVVGAGCVLDALVAIRGRGGSIGRLGLVYLFLRVLFSAAGWLFLTLPSYAVAVMALTRGPRTAEWVDPLQPHAFRGGLVLSFRAPPAVVAMSLHAVPDEAED